MEKIERLINLTAYLLETKSPINMERLRRTVYSDQSSGERAVQRMFERDKEELREMGIEIKTYHRGVKEEVGYMIPEDQYYLPHLDLNTEERVALNMVSRLFLGSGSPFSGPAHSALLKLAFGEEGRGSEEGVSHVRWIGAPQKRNVLDDIMYGLVRRKLISFSYRSLDSSEPVDREVEPYGLFNRRGFWYLVGRCRLRGEVRCFKLDRIQSRVTVNAASPKTPDFEIPERFSLQKEAHWEWPLPLEEEDVVARVRFYPRLAFAHGYGPAKVISADWQPDGSLEVNYEVGDPDEFVGWVLEFGPDALIISPPELRNLALERVTGILKVVKD